MQNLKLALNNVEKIVYRIDGNRTISGDDMFQRVASLSDKLGIKKLIKISELIESNISIYASSRPNTKNHYLNGVVSGALGKGETDLQSQISCLMETVERASQEVTASELIRASFSFLSKSHLALDPKLIFRPLRDKFPNDNEEIMWAKVFCPLLANDLYIPAELIYCPFDCESFKTHRYFASTSNGAASGATYLEAIIHALYEIIERAIIGHLEIGMAFKTALDIDHFFENDPHFTDLKKKYSIQFYYVESFLFPSIPVIKCAVNSQRLFVDGHGCCFNIDIAIKRAYAEALQSLAVAAAGAREDIVISQPDILFNLYPYARKNVIFTNKIFKANKEKNSASSMPLDDLLKKFINTNLFFDTLNQEYSQLVQYLEVAGHPLFCIADLTQPEFKIPVVKIISPSIMGILKTYSLNEFSELRFSRLNSYRFRNISS